MTQAICLKCGASKHGALTPCLKCRFDPTTPEEKAKSILLSSHHMDATSLENAAEAIRAGGTIPIPQDLIDSYAKTVEATPQPRGFGWFLLGCLGGGVIVGVGVLSAIGAAIAGRWSVALYRVGAALGVMYVLGYLSQIYFLWEDNLADLRRRRVRFLLYNALPVAAVVAGLVYLACQGRF